MKNRNPYVGLAAGIGMLILILDSKTALEGARAGLDLCIRTVIPSLFPFFVLSMVFTGALMGTSLRWLRPVGALCGMPGGAEPLLRLFISEPVRGTHHYTRRFPAAEELRKEVRNGH